MKVGFTCSAFDLLHPGHTQMLREAKEQCDYLICGLQLAPYLDRPEKNHPVQTISERYMQLQAVKYVDEIIPYISEYDLEKLIALVSPDVRILGVEYKDKEFTGRKYCEENGIELYFNKRGHTYSTTELRQRVAIAEKMAGKTDA